MSFTTIYLQSNVSVCCIDTLVISKVLILPPASDSATATSGAEILFKDLYGSASSNPFTISTTGSDTIEGGLSFVSLSNNYATITLNSDGVNSWRITDVYRGNGIVPIPGETFSPSNLSNLMLWFDGQDSNSLDIKGGGQVDGWYDKSAFSNTVGAYGVGIATWEQNAINSYPAVSLNERGFLGNLTNPYLGNTLTSFCVAQLQAESFAISRILSFTIGVGTDFDNPNAVAPLMELGPENFGIAQNFEANAETNMFLSNTFILRTQLNSNYLSVASNGNLTPPPDVDTGNYSNLSIYLLGVGTSADSNDASGYWTGLIGEVICYSNVLPLSNMQKVEGYLAWKWGLQSNLPSAHPYKYAAPPP